MSENPRRPPDWWTVGLAAALPTQHWSPYPELVGLAILFIFAYACIAIRDAVRWAWRGWRSGRARRRFSIWLHRLAFRAAPRGSGGSS